MNYWIIKCLVKKNCGKVSKLNIIQKSIFRIILMYLKEKIP